MRPVHDLIPCVQFCVNTQAQHALCNALERADEPFKGEANFYAWLRLQFMSKRTLLEEGLCAAGMTPLPSNGGYFLIAKLPNNHPLVPADSDDNHNIDDEPYDWRYCRMLAHEYGVIGIPASSFFSQRYHETMEGVNAIGMHALPCARRIRPFWKLQSACEIMLTKASSRQDTNLGHACDFEKSVIFVCIVSNWFTMEKSN